MHFQKDVQFFWAHLKIRLFKHKKFSKSQKKYGVLAHYPDYRRDLISDSPTFAAHISAWIFLLQLTSYWNSSSSNTFDLT